VYTCVRSPWHWRARALNIYYLYASLPISLYISVSSSGIRRICRRNKYISYSKIPKLPVVLLTKIIGGLRKLNTGFFLRETNIPTVRHRSPFSGQLVNHAAVVGFSMMECYREIVATRSRANPTNRYRIFFARRLRPLALVFVNVKRKLVNYAYFWIIYIWNSYKAVVGVTANKNDNYNVRNYRKRERNFNENIRRKSSRH